MRRIYKNVVRSVVGVGIALFGTLTVSAAASGTTAISQGFIVNGSVTTGTLVSVTGGSNEVTVTAASNETADKLVGVIGDNELIELSDGQTQTQVVTSGTTYALVSDINGEIKSGDKITASPLSGVGMKAAESGDVVGTAQQDFSSAAQMSEQQISDKSGKKKTVRIGLIAVQVSVAFYQAPDDQLSFLPSFLQKFADAIAGRSVGPLRVLLSFIILIAGLGGVAVLMYASTRSSIISIGRNPLSAKAVHTSLLEVGAIGLGVLLVTVIAVYLILVI